MNNYPYSHTGLLISLVTISILGGGFFIHAHMPAQANTHEVWGTAICTPTAPPSIEGRAGFVYDINAKRALFEKESNAQMPLASITKIMTVLTASRNLEDTALVTITPDALVPEGDSGLRLREVWKLQDLIDFTLITSSNDGAHALGLAASRANREEDEKFIARMNGIAHTIGLTQTYYLNDTGLDVSETTAGAYGSAKDMALLLSYIYENDLDIFSHSSVAETTFTSESGYQHDATHTTAVAGILPGEVISKTGFTDLAGGNLAIVAEPIFGKPLALVVLGSSKEGRETDILSLYEYAKQTLRHQTLCPE